MKIHKEGYTSLFFTFIFIAGLSLLINTIWPAQTIGHYIAYGVFVLIFILVLQFFRSPKIQIQSDDQHILSAADGKVVVIENVTETEFFNEERIQISVFMSPVNVHVNRYPMSGEVKYFKYHPGKYLVAWHPKSSTDNERTTIVSALSEKKSILIRQIAGALARRIVCYSKEGDQARQGEEMGFIKFGSRVDIFVPLDTKVKVKIGDKVTAGKTILASFDQ